MPGLRSLRNRLAVIFALIMLGAIGTIYLSVTPRLEDEPDDQQLDQVAAARAQLRRTSASYLRRGGLRRRRRHGKPDVDGDQADRAASVRRFAERVEHRGARDGRSSEPVPTC